MHTTSFYPVLMTDSVTETTEFYRRTFGFETTFVSDWYVSLQLDRFELAVLQSDHETVPAAYRQQAGGLLLNLEVSDADATYTYLTEELKLEPILKIRSEDFGQRHFIIAAPDGVLVDIIQPIEPAAEFAAAFSEDALQQATSDTR